jgi:hypothetical protein
MPRLVYQSFLHHRTLVHSQNPLKVYLLTLTNSLQIFPPGLQISIALAYQVFFIRQSL